MIARKINNPKKKMTMKLPGITAVLVRLTKPEILDSSPHLARPVFELRG